MGQQEKKGRRDDARNLALDTLLAVEQEGRPSHLVMRDVLRTHRELDAREQRFYRKLVSGTLEWGIRLDYIIDQYAKTKTEKMKPVIRNILRLAVYQITELSGVPDAAAVNEAVRQTVQRGFGSLRGFVNGVLRSVVRGKDAIRWPLAKEDPVRFLSVTCAMPELLVERWCRTLGYERTEKICRSFQRQVPVTVRFRDEMGEDAGPAGVVPAREMLMQAGLQVRQAPYISYAALLEGADGLEQLQAFRDGTITVQDVSSMLAVEAADIRRGATVLDVAAAPGGKSLLAADILQGTGRVIARDVSEQKMVLLRENIRRLGVSNVEPQVWDGTVFDEQMEGRADVVIADLPCSGLGVIGKKPDIRYGASDGRTEQLVILQRKILGNAARYVRQDGTLLYSTCTFDPRENEENVRWILQNTDLQPVPLAPYLPEELKREAGDRCHLQLYPGIHPCDGFFIARFRR